MTSTEMKIEYDGEKLELEIINLPVKTGMFNTENISRPYYAITNAFNIYGYSKESKLDARYDLCQKIPVFIQSYIIRDNLIEYLEACKWEIKLKLNKEGIKLDFYRPLPENDEEILMSFHTSMF